MKLCVQGEEKIDPGDITLDILREVVGVSFFFLCVMRGKMTKSAGAVPKSPRTSLGPSPGPMNRYLSQENGEGERQPGIKGRQTDAKEKKEKKEKRGQNKTAVETSLLSEFRMEQDLEVEGEDGGREEDQQAPQLPTKSDMEKMFAALENSLKIEMTIIHKDL